MKRFLSIIIVWMLCLASYAQEPAGKKLPRVIIHNDSVLLRTFTTGHLTFICDSDTLSQPILLRHRGATSLRYDKPSLALKMVDSIGNKVDVSFLGMRKDNYWYWTRWHPIRHECAIVQQWIYGGRLHLHFGMRRKNPKPETDMTVGWSKCGSTAFRWVCIA